MPDEPSNHVGENGGDSFGEYRRLLLSEINRLDHASMRLESKIDTSSTALRSDIAKIHTDVTMLETRAGTWGGILGAIFGGILAIITSTIMWALSKIP